MWLLVLQRVRTLLEDPIIGAKLNIYNAFDQRYYAFRILWLFITFKSQSGLNGLFVISFNYYL